MVIADALHENKGLEDITLDDNPVGPRGGRAIFRAFKALVYMRRDCDINIKGCSFNLPDPSKDPKVQAAADAASAAGGDKSSSSGTDSAPVAASSGKRCDKDCFSDEAEEDDDRTRTQD